MPDHADHDELRVAFADLEGYAMPHAILPGLDDARATVRRRRTVRAVLGSAAAVVVIAAAASLALTRGLGGDPDAVTTQPPVTVSPPPAQLRLLHDGRRPTALDDAQLNLPDFHHAYCPKGPTQFQDGRWTGPGVPDVFVATASIDEVAEGDVNGDGQADRVALVTCYAGTDPGAYAAQVVAYTGQGTLIGQVTWAAGGQLNLRRPEVTDGGVRVLYVSRPDAGPPAALQWRGFRWNATAFRPGAKSDVELDTRPARLAVTVQPVRWTGDGPNSTVRGTLTVTVANNGGPPLEAIEISLSSGLPLTLTMDGTELHRAEYDALDPYEWRFTIGAIPTGSTGTGTFEVTVPAKSLIGPGHLAVAAFGIGFGGLTMEETGDTNRTDIVVAR